MSEPQDTTNQAGPTPAETVHDSASWARAQGFDQLAVGLDALAAELGYEPPADSTDGQTESSAPAVE